jgi:hypothetical protein
MEREAEAAPQEQSHRGPILEIPAGLAFQQIPVLGRQSSILSISIRQQPSRDSGFGLPMAVVAD